MSRSGDDIQGILTLIGLGGFFIWKGFRDLRLHKKVKGLATSKARSLAMGVVELSGIARHVSPIINDPVYTRPCCYYHLKVEQHRRSGKRSYWATIHQESSDGKGFYCQDTTGSVLIMPKKPELHLNNLIVARNGLFNQSDPSALAFLKSRWSGFSNLRLTLHVIREGDPFYVLGSAMTHRSGSLPPTIAPRTDTGITLSDAARRLKADPEAMKQCDTNNDGQISADEWESGLEKYKLFLQRKKDAETKPMAAQSPLASTVASPTTFEGIVTRADQHELIFANSETDLLSKTGTYSTFQIIGGAISFILGMALLLAKLDLL